MMKRNKSTSILTRTNNYSNLISRIFHWQKPGTITYTLATIDTVTRKNKSLFQRPKVNYTSNNSTTFK